jgi:hypothetical protein
MAHDPPHDGDKGDGKQADLSRQHSTAAQRQDDSTKQDKRAAEQDVRVTRLLGSDCS